VNGDKVVLVSSTLTLSFRRCDGGYFMIRAVLDVSVTACFR